jgi:hypothetical protein
MRNILKGMVLGVGLVRNRFGHGLRQEDHWQMWSIFDAKRLKKVERKDLTERVGNTVGNNSNI